MNFNKSLSWVAGVIFALGMVPSIGFAQPGAFGGGYGPELKVAPPPKTFATSGEHYAYLFEQAKRGTKHTLTSVPRWDGLWVTGTFISPADGGCNGSPEAIERWKTWLAKGYTSSIEAKDKEAKSAR